MSENAPPIEGKRQCGGLLILLLVLGGSLAALCHDAFRPHFVMFSNDGPLGYIKVSSARYPGIFFGHWSMENWIGGEWPVASPTVEAALDLTLQPEGYLKTFMPVSMLLFGFSFWVLFRQLKFSMTACVLGGLAAGLNMHCFSVACWGLGNWNVAMAMAVLAMAALVTESIPQIWARGVLAGMAIGLGIMEGFDVGALLSLYVGVFIVFHFWNTETDKLAAGRKVAVAEPMVVLFAALFACNTLWSLFGLQINGSIAAGDTPESQLAHWDFTTQWSIPKLETLRAFIPGIFGYRMQEFMTDPDKSSAYWGRQAEDPHIDRLLSKDPKIRAAAGKDFGPQIGDYMAGDDQEMHRKVVSYIKGMVQRRHTGAGEYVGIFVSMLALFGVANACRGAGSPFTWPERRMVWLFAFAALFSLVAAWGRYAFLYRWLYEMPVFSAFFAMMRNPMKFMHPFNICWLALAGYGLEALSRRYAAEAADASRNVKVRLAAWWNESGWFDKGWLLASFALVALAFLGWMIYESDRGLLVAYLQDNGFDATLSPKVADFSIHEAWLGMMYLALSLGAIFLLLTRVLSGRWVWAGWGLAALIMIFDLGRSDTPWIRYFDYTKKYSHNFIVDILKDKPWEHRVVGRLSPMGPYDLSSDGNLGALSHFWMENDYPYNDIQNLEIDQAPRLPELDNNFISRLAGVGGNVPGSARLWELTNTKYILCDASVLPYFNQVIDPAHHSFHPAGLYHMICKPWVNKDIEDAGDLTLWPINEPTDSGAVSTNVFALVEYDQALPRAKLFSVWQEIDDPHTLDVLAAPAFDPHQIVLVAKDTPVGQNPSQPGADPGVVNITDYRATDVKLEADAATPATLLLNDRCLLPGDKVGEWDVYVDGERKPILRCNYIMRGVFVPQGHHTIEFRYKAKMTPFYVTMATLAFGIGLAGYLVAGKRQPAPGAPAPAAAPVPASPPPREAAKTSAKSRSKAPARPGKAHSA